MPIKMGDQTYSKFEDASKSVQQSKGLPKERADAYVATIDRKQNEAIDPEQTQSLTTPRTSDVKTEDTQDLTSPQGSAIEAENPQASGQGELSPANPSQDQAEPATNPQDQAKTSEVSTDSDIKKDSEYGSLDGKKYTNNEDKQKDKKRDEQQGLEYNGKSYNKVESIEYDGRIYIPRAREAEDNDLEYDNKFWKEADEEVLELDNEYYEDAEEQGDTIPNPQSSMPQPMPANLPTSDVTPTAESIIIKESNGRLRKYNVFEVDNQDDTTVQKPAEVKDIPPVETPQPNVTQKLDVPKEEPLEQKEPVEEMVAVEKIIVKENGKLKFKTVFQESKKKASENDIGNCDFCKGTGKVTVEHLGLKDCPRCGGDGNVDGTQPSESGLPQVPNQAQVPNQPQGQQPPTSSPPLNQQQPNQQVPAQPKENPFAKPDDKPKENPFEKKDDKKENPFEKKSLECLACPKSVKQFEGWVQRKLSILKLKTAHEGVGLLFGIPTIEQKGKKIKGVLAYAGVSLNFRIYLPEELAKGDGRTLPLLLNHSNVAGAEEELDRLDEKMRGALEKNEDFQVGWVKLRWEPSELTLYYEGVITDPFFQNEVDDAQMAVSLGIWYDSDSPKVCDQECYTLIRGAEFREVSLVYHPGFPIATIEAVEANLKKRAKQVIVTEALTGNSGTITNFTNMATDSNTSIPVHSYSISGVENIGISTNGNTASWTLDGKSVLVSLTGREAKLQPYYSLPKEAKDEANKLKRDIPVQKPEDTTI